MNDYDTTRERLDRLEDLEPDTLTTDQEAELYELRLMVRYFEEGEES